MGRMYLYTYLLAFIPQLKHVGFPARLNANGFGVIRTRSLLVKSQLHRQIVLRTQRVLGDLNTDSRIKSPLSCRVGRKTQSGEPESHRPKRRFAGACLLISHPHILEGVVGVSTNDTVLYSVRDAYPHGYMKPRLSPLPFALPLSWSMELRPVFLPGHLAFLHIYTMRQGRLELPSDRWQRPMLTTTPLTQFTTKRRFELLRSFRPFCLSKAVPSAQLGHFVREPGRGLEPPRPFTAHQFSIPGKTCSQDFQTGAITVTPPQHSRLARYQLRHPSMMDEPRLERGFSCMPCRCDTNFTTRPNGEGAI